MNGALPLLYSFRRCPFAIRARLAICYSGLSVELREVVLRDKPACMLAYSPKGEVPVLVLNDGTVIDESIDIAYWALGHSDPENWLPAGIGQRELTAALIEENDSSFKTSLDKYKYADRHPEHPPAYYRAQGEIFLQKLEHRLVANAYLLGSSMSIADVAVLPFIRQFAFVDTPWFEQSPYPKVRNWLQGFLQWGMFQRVMTKYPQWQPGDKPTIFP